MKADVQKYRNEIIIRLHQEGIAQARIAKIMALSQGRVSQVLRSIGVDENEVKMPNYRGAGSKLTEEQTEELKLVLASRPDDHGLEGAKWTAKKLQEFIRNKYGAEYHLNHISKIIRNKDQS